MLVTTQSNFSQWFMSLVLQVSALHYLARDWVLEGFQTVASARVLRQPTIVGPSISIINVHSLELYQN